jgi:O-antigen ligase
VVAAFLPVSLFLSAGFISVAVIWLAAMAAFSFKPEMIPQLKRHYLLYFPMALFILYAAGLLFSDNVGLAVDIALKKIHLLLIPAAFLIANRKFTSNDFHVILMIFLIGCLIASLFCYGSAAVNIFEHKALVDPETQFYYFSSVPLADSISISPVYLSVFANLAFVVALTSPLIRTRLIRYTTGLYLVVFILLIAVKSGIVMLFVSAIIIFFPAVSRRFAAYAVVFSVLFFLVLAALGVSFLRQQDSVTVASKGKEASGSIWKAAKMHLAIWKCAIDAIEREPFTGYGPGDAQLALEKVYEEQGLIFGLRYREDPRVPQYNAHNEYLSTWLDVGVLGPLCLVLGLGFSIFFAIRSGNIIAGCFIAITVITFCFESFLFRQKGIVFFAYFYTLIFWHLRSSELAGSVESDQAFNEAKR